MFRMRGPAGWSSKGATPDRPFTSPIANLLALLGLSEEFSAPNCPRSGVSTSGNGLQEASQRMHVSGQPLPVCLQCLGDAFGAPRIWGSSSVLLGVDCPPPWKRPIRWVLRYELFCPFSFILIVLSFLRVFIDRSTSASSGRIALREFVLKRFCFHLITVS